MSDPSENQEIPNLSWNLQSENSQDNVDYHFRDLKSLVECPVCFCVAFPPIYNCKAGHIICHNCHPKMTSCPVCREPSINGRNLIAEKLVESCTRKCSYEKEGCTYLVRLGEKTEHEQNCKYRLHEIMKSNFSLF